MMDYLVDLFIMLQVYVLELSSGMMDSLKKNFYVRFFSLGNSGVRNFRLMLNCFLHLSGRCIKFFEARSVEPNLVGGGL